jgi:DnaJ-domain-containing protein 1
MNNEEKARYLANIYYVLLADGQVDRVEERVFEEMSREIGAGYFERKEALDLARKPGYRVEPAGRWSQQVRNLEDMLFAAFADDAFHPAEKKAVREYAAGLGIDQKQFTRVIEEAKQRYAEFRAKKK